MASLFRFIAGDGPWFTRRTKIILGLVLVLLVVWWSRVIWMRLMPIEHTGVVYRINTFNKGWYDSKGTRQQIQFSILFEDGFDCEGYDTSFVNVREGDRIKIKGYHDVGGWPWKADFWECDEGQLVKIWPVVEPAVEPDMEPDRQR